MILRTNVHACLKQGMLGVGGISLLENFEPNSLNRNEMDGVYILRNLN